MPTRGAGDEISQEATDGSLVTQRPLAVAHVGPNSRACGERRPPRDYWDRPHRSDR